MPISAVDLPFSILEIRHCVMPTCLASSAYAQLRSRRLERIDMPMTSGLPTSKGPMVVLPGAVKRGQYHLSILVAYPSLGHATIRGRRRIAHGVWLDIRTRKNPASEPSTTADASSAPAGRARGPAAACDWKLKSWLSQKRWKALSVRIAIQCILQGTR